MAAKKTIRQMLEAGEFIWAPCIYDCVSARVVEMCGYNACLISSCELEFAMNGIPAGLYNWEEYIWATERIANSTTLPVIVDGENGGGTPMQGHMHRQLWATNVHAAVEAVKGTDCMIIARTDCKGGGAAQIGAIGENPFCLGLDEAILRAKMGVEAGAEITMIQNICHAGCEEECGRIVAEVPGYRFYPDVHATDGAPDLTLEQMQEMGFHLVSNHAAMKGATKGMMEYFRENFKNKNTVYSENDEFYNMGHVFTPFKMEDWIERDKSYEAYEKELREKSMAGR